MELIYCNAMRFIDNSKYEGINLTVGRESVRSFIEERNT